MKPAGHGWRLSLCLAALFVCAGSGCNTHNPAYFPNYFFPFGDISPTHAKPGGPGYFNNFDPHAVRLEVRPIGASDCNIVNQVRTQHVLLATVYDDKNQPRRNRRIEWMLEGVGNILEVDESGVLAGRGYKTNNKHGVSYTACSEHRLNRGNTNAGDDFMVRPGQTWCSVTSAVEGDTHLTVYAPGIHDWEKNKVYTTIRWVDVIWEFPQPAQARFGSEHVFTTRLYRATDKQPLANYRVRYRILDGPAALFLPSQTTDFTAISDLAGNAQVAIKQAAPVQGVNRIGIEIIRPPDPNAPSGSGIVIARGETSVEWMAPNVALNHTGPASAVLGQDISYATTVQNTGKIESQGITITAPIPEGLQYVRSQPPAFSDGKQLVWTLGVLNPGQSQTVQAIYKTTRQGTVTSSAIMQTAEGQRDQKDVVTQVSVAALKVSITGPATAVVGQPITLQMNVTNPGSGPLENVLLTAQFDPNLQHQQGVNTLNNQLGTLAAQETRTAQLVLVPKAAGRLATRVIATANNLSDTAEHVVTVQEPQMVLEIDPRNRCYAGRNVDWVIRVKNPADAPLANVMVRDKLPPELQFISASQQGQHQNGEVVWNLGELQPREERVLQLTTKCVNITKQAVKTVTAASESGVRKEAQAGIEIFGLAALTPRLVTQGGPAEVGKKITYQIGVTNQGNVPADDIEVRVTIPAETKFLSAKGPTADKENVVGPLIVFPKMTNVAPGQQLVYIVEVEAVRPVNDTRCRLEVRSPILVGGPLIEEETTRIFDPNQAPPVPPPPPPPP
jgi:uncharacterized repeat protein (TIGR01451 family)